MVAKYLIAGVVSAALAGGAVWVGADAGELGALSVDHPHHDTKVKAKVDAPRVTRRDMAEPSDEPASGSSRATVDSMVRKAKPADRPAKADAHDHQDGAHGHEDASHEQKTKAKAPAARPASKDDQSDDTQPRRAWLDDYLKSRKDDGPKTSRKTMEPDARDTSPMRTTIEKFDPETIETLRTETDRDSGTAKSTSTLRIVRKDGKTIITEDDVEIKDGIETEIDGKKIRIMMRDGDGSAAANGLFVDGKSWIMRGSDAPKPPSSETYALLMDEAAKLKIDDMRDDAYLNIIDYANSHQDYDRSLGLVDELSAPELRDLARQKIAVSHAEVGKLDAAFGLVEQLETPELKAPIRLEIIRTAARVKDHGKH